MVSAAKHVPMFPGRAALTAAAFAAGVLLGAAGCDTGRPPAVKAPGHRDENTPAPRRQVTPKWSIELEPVFRREEHRDGISLAAPGRTIWVDGWRTPDENDRDTTLAWLKEQANPGRRELFEEQSDGVARFGYLLREIDAGKPRWAVYAYAIDDDGYLQLAIYFADEQDLDWATRVARSAQPSAKPPTARPPGGDPPGQPEA